ncbi:MAG TPA: hypothetical protein VII99_03485, partial [Bacteroidia bacterium]
MKYYLLLFSFFSIRAFSQTDYEIEVYPSKTQEKGFTTAELHSNYSFYHKKDSLMGVPSSSQPLHATIEIT